MNHRTSVTIEAYREQCRQLRSFGEAHVLSPEDTHGALASTVIESLAGTGSPALFLEVEEQVRQLVLRDLRRFKRTGQRELCYPHAGRYQDGRGAARAAIATLFHADLVSESMTRIAVPQPMFSGMELIGGVHALLERLPLDQTLLDVELVALAQIVPNPRAHAQQWSMSLLITEHERHDIDEEFYERIPVRSCIATFALHKHVTLLFWPRFGFGQVLRMRVIEQQRSRGRTARQVKHTMVDKGRLYCDAMELLRMEEIDCTLPV
jgi:hypothetical protein